MANPQTSNSKHKAPHSSLSSLSEKPEKLNIFTRKPRERGKGKEKGSVTEKSLVSALSSWRLRRVSSGNLAPCRRRIPISGHCSINRFTSSLKTTFLSSLARIAANTSKKKVSLFTYSLCRYFCSLSAWKVLGSEGVVVSVQECEGRPGTNLRRSSK